ncbi:hypothetical protein [Streptomyces sp. NPDC048411]|uniref:hypothetical protein n=1 Tax=Streptomyces sp. NPDC048411 TaxID=3157206 RepID=UPI0034541743
MRPGQADGRRLSPRPPAEGSPTTHAIVPTLGRPGQHHCVDGDIWCLHGDPERIGACPAPKERRIRSHERKGRPLLVASPVPTGRDATAIDRVVLDKLKTRDATAPEGYRSAY